MGIYIIFSIQDQHYSLELNSVDSVVNAAELIPFQTGSDFILGLLNYHGTMIPVLNTRKILGLPERELEISDQFIICKKEKLKFALFVDHTTELKDLSSYLNNADHDSDKFQSCIQCAITCDEKVIQILKPDNFAALTPAMQG